VAWKTRALQAAAPAAAVPAAVAINTVKGEWLIKTARDIMFFGFVMLACPVSFLKKDFRQAGMTG